MVDKLETLGLVDRQVNPEDRRELVLRLTTAGRQPVEKVLARRYDEIVARLPACPLARLPACPLARLPAHQRTGLVKALRALIETAGEPAVDSLTEAPTV
ncbi:hypothetical protein [Streptomyces natalensis]|uniref:hypothetical protein n=1 Tax=Streptomyces natalensis TaxID=68242 RepID=UPI001F515FAB|nr:hypothetical protein [Streptomyces natalensis]